MKKKLLVLTVGLVVPFLFACTEEEVTKPVESISLNKTETILNIGSEEILKATAQPVEASQEFVWKSSAPNAVTVIGGKIHAYALPEEIYKEEEKAKYYDETKAQYFVEISASNYTKNKNDALKTAICKVFVTNDPIDTSVDPESISISQDRLDFVLDSDPSDDAIEISATVLPFNAGERGIEWSFVSDGDNPVISLGAPVEGERSSKVSVTPVKEGTALITAKSVGVDAEGNHLSTSCAVNVTTKPGVVKAKNLQFNPKDLRVEQGQTQPTSVVVTPFNAVNKEVEYSSDNPKITVDSAGYVTASNECSPGDTATITAKTKITEEVPNVADQLVDTIDVTVDMHHVNYMFIKRSTSAVWIAEEIYPVTDGSSEFFVDDIHLQAGDKFVFCTGEETWHHFAQIKEGTGSAIGDFIADGEDIVVGRSGYYDIYIQSNELLWVEGRSIWIESDSYDPITMSLTVVHNGEVGDPEVMPLKDGSDTEFTITKSLEAGDEVIFDMSGAVVGFNQIKDNITAPVEKGTKSADHIKVQHTLSYNFFVESGVVADGKRIWINSNYMQIKRAGSEDWTYVNVGINPEEGKSTEYLAKDVELAIGDTLVFNVGNGWYHRPNIKLDNAFINNFDFDDDWNLLCNTAGKYDFYIETKDGPMDGENYRETIWIVYHSDAAKLLVKDGDPISLDPKDDHEFVINNVTIPEGTEFIAQVEGVKYGFDKLKSGSASGAFEEGTTESEGVKYLKAKSSLKVSIFVDKNADGEGKHIWISADFMMVYTSKWTFTNIFVSPTPEEGKEKEYVVQGVSLSNGNKVLFCINNEYYKYSNLKTDSRIYSTFFSDEDGNIVIRNNCTYDFYIETKDGPMDGETPRLVIWAACEAEATPQYTISVPTNLDSRKWYLDAGATLYAYAFNSNGGEKWIKGTVEGEGTSRRVLFAIPGIYDKAAFVRVFGTISNVDTWSGINDIPEDKQWNRTAEGQDIVLSGHTGGIDFQLGDWPHNH